MSIAQTSSPINSLSEVPEGMTCCLHQSDLEQSSSELLQAMGLVEDCSFQVCRNKGTCVLQVHSTRLGLSRELASKIQVRVVN